MGKLGRVIVVGAGPAGLSAAYWLSQQGVEITLVERSSGLRRGGVAIDVRGAAIAVSREMGVWDDILERCTRIDTLSLLREHGRSTIHVDLASIPKNRTEQVELFRGDLVEVLHARLPKQCQVVFGERITEIKASKQGVEVFFESGSSRRADLVIGADGQRSDVRRLARLDAPLRHLGAWVGVYSLRNRLGLENAAEVYNKPGRLLTVFTTPDNQNVIAAFLYRDCDQDPKNLPAHERIRRVFSDYTHRTPEILRSMPEDDDLYFDSISQVKIPRWSDSCRVVLLGDAAWGPSLLSGQGTSLAMVGAHVLAQEFEHHCGIDLAITAFEQRMRPFVRKNQELANVGLGVVLPSSRVAIALRNQMMRFAPLFARLNAGLDRRVLHAANHIDLNRSPAC